MKKSYLKHLLLGLAICGLPMAYGQIHKKTASLAAEGLTATTSSALEGHSHDFGGEHAGEHCFADHITNAWLEEKGIAEQYKEERQRDAQAASEMTAGDRATYTIPVIFHILYNTAAENVPTADIYDLFDMVNLDFSSSNPDVGDARGAYGFVPADADIQFCLAAYDPSGTPLTEYGIHRVSTAETYFNPDTETNKMKSSATNGTDPWDRNQYINVWVCDITNGAASGTAGYAYKPTTTTLPPASIDGIVIDYNLGIPPTNRVLTHELGHFLGLDHTWGGGSGSCATDDGLTDTPNNKGPSFNFSGSCSGFQETCPGTQTQYENFMDYSNCQVMYTTEQTNLMQAVCAGSRNVLTTSATCTPLFPTPPVADFVADVTTIIEGGTVNFTDLSTNWPTGWSWNITPAGGVSYIGGTSSTDQNPVVQFSTAGTFTVALTATNASGSDTETKVDYIVVNPAGGGAIACDTLRNYTAAEGDNATYYGLTGEEGYYPSKATLSSGTLWMTRHAEIYNAPSATNVRRIRFPVIQVDDIGPSTNVVFNVYTDAGGLPGTIIGTESVPMSSLNEGYWNEIDFSPEIPVSGNFWVGWDLGTVAAEGFDTLLMLTTNFGDRPPGTSTSAEYYTNGFSGAWILTSDLFASGPDASLILDVLTSNGPAPNASVVWPDVETCVGMEISMNGSGSTNTDSYYWDIYHVTGASGYYATGPSITYTFGAGEEGTWEFELLADGSCLTDPSGVFTLTVNPELSGSINTTDETCVASDGEIDFSGVSGGSGSGYQYSINSGATFSGSPTFTGLISGSYNWVITDDGNCEATGTLTVGNTNPFSPTITPDQTITPGTPTDLTVTGGTSWTWYAGGDPAVIGTTATINVSPTVTTTYYCSVEDGSGCTADLEVTVYMDPAGVTDEDIANGFTIYPNPSNGIFNLHFMLSEATDLNVEVISMLGERVMQKNLYGVKNQTLPVSVDNVAEGVYFVVIKTEDKTVSKKLVIKK